MKDYMVKLALTGTMTQVPDSQKLFGALVYLFAETYNQESATKLTKAVLEKTMHLALSNVMPFGYLPTPQDYLVDCITESGKDSSLDTDLKKQRAAIKERTYIRSGDLEGVLNDPKSCESICPYVRQRDQQQPRAFIESNYYDTPVLDNSLYSVPTIVLSEINRKEEEVKCNTFGKIYCFYLQVDDSELGSDLRKMIDSAVSAKLIIPLGKRSSQGLNTFCFCGIEEQNIRNSTDGFFLNTGMLLPDRIDFTASSIKLFTSERRPFEMAGGWNGTSDKYYISFIAQGSVIAAPDGLENTGKSIASPFRKNRDVVFGNAFLYPVMLKGKRG